MEIKLEDCKGCLANIIEQNRKICEICKNENYSYFVPDISKSENKHNFLKTGWVKNKKDERNAYAITGVRYNSKKEPSLLRINGDWYSLGFVENYFKPCESPFPQG